jgi:hypothetical protein
MQLFQGLVMNNNSLWRLMLIKLMMNLEPMTMQSHCLKYPNSRTGRARDR